MISGNCYTCFAPNVKYNFVLLLCKLFSLYTSLQQATPSTDKLIHYTLNQIAAIWVNNKIKQSTSLRPQSLRIALICPGKFKRVIILPIVSNSPSRAFQCFVPIYCNLQPVESLTLVVESCAHCTNDYLWYSFKIFVHIGIHSALLHSDFVGYKTQLFCRN